MARKTRPTLSKSRCEWAGDVHEKYLLYHDQEWGVPVHDHLLKCFRHAECARMG